MLQLETINRTMMYATQNESTFNRTTGLTLPYVLGEYLLFPEEVVGIERMLASQKNNQECLRRYHRAALVKEVQRQGREGVGVQCGHAR